MALPSRELTEAQLDALAARERTRIVAPLTEWHTLALQLREEGIVRGSGPAADSWRSTGAGTTAGAPYDVAPRRRGWGRTMHWTRRVAVGAALVGTGVVVGRGMTLGDQVVPLLRGALADSNVVAVSAGSNGTSIRITSHGFRSPVEAEATLARAQSDYQRAAAYLAASDTLAPPVSPAMYRDRLTALDDMMAASLAALRAAPGDPLLNQYYLSTVGAREATLQQLRRTLPTDARLVRF